MNPHPAAEAHPSAELTPLTGHSLLAGREVPGTGASWHAVAAATG
ncbi:NADP-dependent aldehyde dehydrogenase, partial [Streptomyces sp. Ncost-T6T-2b]